MESIQSSLANNSITITPTSSLININSDGSSKPEITITTNEPPSISITTAPSNLPPVTLVKSSVPTITAKVTESPSTNSGSTVGSNVSTSISTPISSNILTITPKSQPTGNTSSSVTVTTSSTASSSSSSLTTTGIATNGTSSNEPQANGTAATAATANPVVILNRQRLQELVAEIDSKEQLDEDVEDMLLNIADDFIDNLVTGACLLAKHRGSKNVETKDIQLTLEKNYNMHIPGFGSLPLIDEFKHVYKKSPATEAHKQRMALIKKNLKRF